MSEPSRKNVRFSGKNSGKRVRFVWRVSTSVSAKSVLSVADASRLAPSRCVTSRLTSFVADRSAPGAGISVPAVTDGRTLTPMPSSKSGRPSSRPARETWVIW